MKRTLLVLSAIACLVLTSAGSAGAAKPVMQTGGDKQRAARILDVDLSTLYRWQRDRASSRKGGSAS